MLHVIGILEQSAVFIARHNEFQNVIAEEDVKNALLVNLKFIGHFF